MFFLLQIFLLLISAGRAENVAFSYNSGDGTVMPPASFGMTYLSIPLSGAAMQWAENPLFYPTFAITPPGAGYQHLIHTGSFCGIGANSSVVAPNSPVAFGSPSVGVLGIISYVHGGGTVTVQLVTNKRTFTVDTTYVRWGGSQSPFVVSDDAKVILGYRYSPPSLGSAAGMSYRIYDLDPDEWAVSFNGNPQVNDDAGCGGTMTGMKGTYFALSGVRVKATGGILDLASESPHRPASKPWRAGKTAGPAALMTVPIGHPQASPVRLMTASGIRAIRKYTP